MKKYLIGFVSLFLIFLGCGHRHEQETGHAEPEKIQYTVYSADWELFAEADPFIAGEKAQILAHFTRMADFKPLSPVPVSVTLKSGGRENGQISGVPVRDGIYTFELTPEIAGGGVLSFHFQTGEGEYNLEVPDVQVFASAEEGHAAVHQKEEDNTNCTVFTKEQSWKSNFATGLPEKLAFGSVIRSIARVEPAPGDEMVISAKTNGMVLFAGNSLTSGAAVSKGQFLMTISGNGLAEENIGLKIEEARNNFQQSEADFERKTKLAGEKLIPEKELQESKAHYLNSKAVYENLRDNFRRDGQTVVSPMTGFIRKLLVQNGEYAATGQPLLVVSKDNSLVLTADVLQKYHQEIGKMNGFTLRPLPGNKTFSLEELNGRLLSVGGSLNSANGMFPVTLQVSNSGEFIPGGLVELLIRCKTDREQLTIPVEALMEEQGLYYVFVQRSPELFERREIIPGASDGLRVVIISGLQEGERVITKGAVLVKLAKASGALDPHAGHVH